MLRLTQIDTDPALIERAQAGERQALAEIYRRYAPAARNVVHRLINRRGVADDLHQDTFVEVLQRLGELRDHRAIGAWIRSIAVSKCLMHLRSPWHRSAVWLDQVAGGWDVPQELARSDEYSDGAAGRKLDRAMRRLPATARAVVWLHDVEEMTHEEIGRLFGHTASFSKSQLLRAHRRLRRLLENDSEKLSCTQISQSF
ncbi:MAG TPA: RNA polymerase sigma factor [Steroidobacteraceae bacterium]|nr:RNA polymerase sigma factor [Steroidobacteraceae bacterium]